MAGPRSAECRAKQAEAARKRWASPEARDARDLAVTGSRHGTHLREQFIRPLDGAHDFSGSTSRSTIQPTAGFILMRSGGHMG